MKQLTLSALLKQLMLSTLLIVLVGSFTFSLAQGTAGDLPGFDLGALVALASNPVALGLLIFGLVQTAKRQAEARKPPIVWNPWLWRGVAAGFGVVCSLLLHLWTGQAVLGAPGWPGALVFGLVAAVLAVAGRDGLKTILGWVAGAGQVTQTTTQASAPDGGTVATTTTTAPAGSVGLPTPPSGLESLVDDAPPASAFEQSQPRPLLAAQSLLSAAPLAGLPPAVSATLTGLLVEAFGGEVPSHVATQFALRLAPLLPDLLDGSPYLSAENRNRVLGLIMDLKAEVAK